MQVVIADDDRIAREVLSRTLGAWGFTVTAAADGAEAWAAIAGATSPTLVVLDWMMPGFDGPTLCRRVRAELPTANLYLILLTALESRKDVVAGLEAGADDYVVKPFDPEELRARVNVGVRVLSLQDKLNARVAELQEALSNVKQLNWLLPICSYCKRIRGDDEYWEQVEGYVAAHSGAQFSHGICPSCFLEVEKEIEREAARRASDR